jgi:hypothetical protein
MKKYIAQIILAGALLCYHQAATAATTSINFDDVSSMTMIDDYYSGMGILFSTAGSTADGHAYVINSTYNTSPLNIIGCLSTAWLNSSCIGMATFGSLTDHVEVYASTERAYATSWAWMKAYDSSGMILETVEAYNTHGNPELLMLDRPTADISYVEFMGKSTRHVYFDDFSFNTAVAPEPVSSVLFLAGGSLLASKGYFRRRKKR